MEIKTDLEGIEKYITIVGLLSGKLLKMEPYCSLPPKALMVYAYLSYYKNDVYGHLGEEIANKLTFDTDTKKKIVEALDIDLMGLSNYTKQLKDKGILNPDKKSFVKKYDIQNMKSFTIKFKE